MKLPPLGELQLRLKDFHLPQKPHCATSSLSVYETEEDVDSGGGPEAKTWTRAWHRCGIWGQGLQIYASAPAVKAVKIVFLTYPHEKAEDRNSRGFVLQYNVTRRKIDDYVSPTRKFTTTTTSSRTTSKTTPKTTSKTPNGTTFNSSDAGTTAFRNSPTAVSPSTKEIVPQDSLGLTEVILCVSAAGVVVILALGLAALLCAKKYQKNQIFQRTVTSSSSISRSSRRSNGGGNNRHRGAGSSSLGRDALLQPYYMGAANETDATLQRHPHLPHKPLSRPSTALSQYPIFGEDVWADDSSSCPVTNVTYSSPTYNYQGLPTTEL